MNKLLKIASLINDGIRYPNKSKDTLILSRIAKRIFNEIDNCRSVREIEICKSRIDLELNTHIGNPSLTTLNDAIDRHIHIHKSYLETKDAINLNKRNPLYKSINKTA